MENVPSRKEKELMKLNAENIGKAIRAWMKTCPEKSEGECMALLSKKTGVSERTLNSFKNFYGGDGGPNPRLDTIISIMKGIDCEAEFFPKHKFE